MIELLTIFGATPIEFAPLPGSSSPTGIATTSTLQVILSIVFAIVGALSLLVITISGLRYILANGDPQKIAQAKNGIIYSLIGLVVAIIAEGLVAFVVRALD